MKHNEKIHEAVLAAWDRFSIPRRQHSAVKRAAQDLAVELKDVSLWRVIRYLAARIAHLEYLVSDASAPSHSRTFRRLVEDYEDKYLKEIEPEPREESP